LSADYRPIDCSTKFAVTGLTEGLAEELRPFGISVCCIEPGYTRTGFLSNGADGGDHRIKTARQLDVYHGTEAAKMRDALGVYNGNQLGDVGKCAKAIVDVLTMEGVAKGREVPVRLVLGSDCLETVRAKCESTLKLVKEWEDVANSTYP
jgi:NAD(P)-dependent dehydrogenase (short-subunit alcohol dehydrogenase family)